jgi:hypothetical protein
MKSDRPRARVHDKVLLCAVRIRHLGGNQITDFKLKDSGLADSDDLICRKKVSGNRAIESGGFVYRRPARARE